MISLSIDRKGEILVGSTVHISVNDQGIPQMPFHELTFEFTVSEANDSTHPHVLKRFSLSKVCVWSPKQEGEWILRAIPKLRLCESHNKKLAISCELHVPPATLTVTVIPRIKGKVPMTFTTNNPTICMYTIPYEGIPEGTKLVRVAFKKKPEPPKKVSGKKGQAQAASPALPLRREEAPPTRTESSEIENDDIPKEGDAETSEANSPKQEGKKVETQGRKEEGEAKDEKTTLVIPEEGDDESEVSELQKDQKKVRTTATSVKGKYLDKKLEATPFEQEGNPSTDWTFTRSFSASAQLNDKKGMYIFVPGLEPKTVYQLKHQCFVIRTEEVPKPNLSSGIASPVEGGDSSGSANTGSGPGGNELEDTTRHTKIKKSIIELPQPIEFMTDSVKGKAAPIAVTVAPTKETLDCIISTEETHSSGSTEDEALAKKHQDFYSQVIKNDLAFISPITQSSSITQDPMLYSLAKRKTLWTLKGDSNPLVCPVILEVSQDHGSIIVASKGEKDTSSSEVSTSSTRSGGNDPNGLSSPSSTSDSAWGSLLPHALTLLSQVNMTGLPHASVTLRAVNEQLMAVGQSRCVSFGLDAKLLSFSKDKGHGHEGEVAIICKQEHELPIELEDTLQALFSKDSSNKELNKELRSLMLQQRNIVNDSSNAGGSVLSKKNVNTQATFDTEEKTRKQVSLITDLIVVLDKNLRLVWCWSAYDSILEGTWQCKNGHMGNPTGKSWKTPQAQDTSKFKLCDPIVPAMFIEGSCFPLQHGYLGLDITGATTLNEAPDGSGDLIVSFMYQDTIMRIHREQKTSWGGFGMDQDTSGMLEDGSVMWRLGPDGDFGILTDNEAKKGCEPDRTLGPNSSLWWSHQQCSRVYPLPPDPSDEFGNTFQVAILDAGTKVHEMQALRRPTERKSGNSRGIVLAINEATKVATIKAEIDLGFYSCHSGDAEYVQDLGKDGGYVGAIPRFFFGGYSEAGSEVEGKKGKKGAYLFAETTLPGDVVWAGRIEADVAKVIRRFTNKTQTVNSQMATSPVFSNRHTNAYPSPYASRGEEPKRNVVELSGCGLEIFVNNVEEATEKVATLFRLRRERGQLGTLVLVDGMHLTFKQREGDLVPPEYTIALRYNNEQSVQEIKKEMEDKGLGASIEAGGVGAQANSFSCKLYGVKWEVKSE